MNILMYAAWAVRAKMMRFIKPNESYWLATKSLEPISMKFGYDRGTPIDRYWIESFLEKNKQYIKGHCLEVTDSAYTIRFGEDRVKKMDVLDIDTSNKKATLYGDLRNLKDIPSNSFDTLVMTHVLGIIDDCQSAANECYRILKPGGTLLLTVSSISPTRDMDLNCWRFSIPAIKYLFGSLFKEKNMDIQGYGNVLAGQCFWVGMSQEELTKKQLDFVDPRFTCLVSLRATK